MTERMKNKIEAECKESCHPAVFEAAIDWYLKNIWHDVSEEPKKNSIIVMNNAQTTLSVEYDGQCLAGVERWAYLDDLLPDTFKED